ncbi:ROK family protein [Salicibibacter cibi]|uniref:ROK family protein n=1 Tax=Salicibibacter cibi TaxID=2743001 RepID=A0A7T6ZAA0_9BACI|nr:ROK family protein [Salicibibacter cibi]QQK79732.1 ROK family protein [Salicibibacter cibi]
MASYIVGADVGDTTTKFGLLTNKGECRDQRKIPTDKENGGNGFPPQIIVGIEERLGKHGISKNQLFSVVVGVPGCIDEYEAVVSAPNIGWGNYPFHSVLAGALHVPVSIMTRILGLRTNIGKPPEKRIRQLFL